MLPMIQSLSGRNDQLRLHFLEGGAIRIILVNLAEPSTKTSGSESTIKCVNVRKAKITIFFYFGYEGQAKLANEFMQFQYKHRKVL